MKLLQARPIDRLLPVCIAIAALGTAFACAAPAFGQAAISRIALKKNESALATYRWEANPNKPYLDTLFSPKAVQVLRDSPADHKHHHGLMFAVAVDGVDFWSENADCGLVKNRKEEFKDAARDGVKGTRVEQQLEWVAPQGKLMLREARAVEAAEVSDGPATVVLWESKLDVPDKEPARLSGASYFGLGMRFVQSMDKGGRFFNADGKTGVAGTNEARSAWCAYSAAADGKPVTVAVFDLPANPRHPATWFTMDQGFAYISATLNLHKEPFVIDPGKPLVLRYAVAVWDGSVDAAVVDRVHRRILAWHKP